jgi:hypothetical protein
VLGHHGRLKNVIVNVSVIAGVGAAEELRIAEVVADDRVTAVALAHTALNLKKKACQKVK